MLTTNQISELRPGFQKISGAKYKTKEAQQKAFSDIYRSGDVGASGSYLAGKLRQPTIQKPSQAQLGAIQSKLEGVIARGEGAYQTQSVAPVEGIHYNPPYSPPASGAPPAPTPTSPTPPAGSGALEGDVIKDTTPTPTALQTLQQKYLESLQMTPEETALQEQLNKQFQATETGVEKIEAKPILTNLLWGQKERLLKQAGIATGGLQRQLALEQQKRTGMQQQLGTQVGWEYQAEQRRLAEESKIAAETRAEERGLSAEEREAEQATIDFQRELALSGYEKISGPSGLAGLTEDDIVRMPNGDIWKKPAEIDDLDTLLSVSEITTLGLPYGTTQRQAMQMGITPSRYRPSSTTTPPSDTQQVNPMVDIVNNLIGLRDSGQLTDENYKTSISQAMSLIGANETERGDIESQINQLMEGGITDMVDPEVAGYVDLVKSGKMQFIQALKEIDKSKKADLVVKLAKTRTSADVLQESIATEKSQLALNLKTHKGFDPSVGIGTGRIAMPWRIAEKQDFIAGIQQLVSGLSLEALIEAKSRGATFGALSDTEMQILSSAATKIGTWMIRDDTGKIKGYKTSHGAMKKELDKINNNLLRGLNPNRQTMPDGTVWELQSDGSYLQIK